VNFHDLLCDVIRMVSWRSAVSSALFVPFLMRSLPCLPHKSRAIFLCLLVMTRNCWDPTIAEHN